MAFQTKFDGSTDTTIRLGGEGNPGSIEGYFLGSKETESDYGPGKLHIFQTSEGTVGVWGKTRMNSLLTKELAGQMCRVTFTGMIAPSKKGRKPSYGYKVEHDPQNVIDVGNINLQATADSESEEDDVNEDSHETYSDSAPRYTAPVGRSTTPPATSSNQSKVQNLLNNRNR